MFVIGFMFFCFIWVIFCRWFVKFVLCSFVICCGNLYLSIGFVGNEYYSSSRSGLYIVSVIRFGDV